MTLLALIILPILTLVLGFAWGLRRGIRRNLKLFSETIQVIDIMLKDGDVEQAREFIRKLVRD